MVISCKIDKNIVANDRYLHVVSNWMFTYYKIFNNDLHHFFNVFRG
jgi:hypothetical protein